VLGEAPGTPRALLKVGSLIEGPGFYPYLSGRTNLRIMARYRGLPDRAADGALARVDRPIAAATGSAATHWA